MIQVAVKICHKTQIIFFPEEQTRFIFKQNNTHKHYDVWNF